MTNTNALTSAEWLHIRVLLEYERDSYAGVVDSSTRPENEELRSKIAALDVTIGKVATALSARS
jgi:hypothetical protein